MSQKMVWMAIMMIINRSKIMMRPPSTMSFRFEYLFGVWRASMRELWDWLTNEIYWYFTPTIVEYSSHIITSIVKVNTLTYVLCITQSYLYIHTSKLGLTVCSMPLRCSKPIYSNAVHFDYNSEINVRGWFEWKKFILMYIMWILVFIGTW